MIRPTTARIVLASLLGALALAGCERPPMETVQRGFRGTGMTEVDNPRTLAHQATLNVAPPALPSMGTDGEKAGKVFQNVKVLGDLSIGEFTRTMTAMSSWVAPEQGCAFCHDLNNLADDSKYQKVVSRRMLEMTRHLNASWKSHVADTGVTCYTCHRGEAVPRQVWFNGAPAKSHGMAAQTGGQNSPAVLAGLTAMASDPLSPFLSKTAGNIRVVASQALPSGGGHSIQQTEGSYGLMMYISQSLGVNCNYCHNSRSFTDWSQSSPQRVTAWHGLKMTRDLNTSYLEPLQPVFPATRLGPTGDAPKVGCATCHQGAYKPLYGAKMAHDYPALMTGKAD